MEKEIPIFSWNTKTEEFTVLGKKFDGVNSIDDFTNYIINLDKQLQTFKAKEDKLREWTKGKELIKSVKEKRYILPDGTLTNIMIPIYKNEIDDILQILNESEESK